MTAAGSDMAARAGRSIWLCPIAAAVLAAWPVWRSLFPETPDLVLAGLPGQLAVAVGEVILCGLWFARFRHRMNRYVLPLGGLGVAIILAAMGHSRGDAALADLAALSIAWLVTSLLFAGGILLHGQAALAALQGAPVAPVDLMHPSHEKIGTWLFVIALLVAGSRQTPLGFLFAALAVVSPGAILGWAALCDVARMILWRRKAYVGDVAELLALPKLRRMVFATIEMLITDRLKVTSILPADDIKPGEVVSMAAALLADDDSVWARAIQDFGVSHRVRVPHVKPVDAGEAGRHRGKMPDRRITDIALLDPGAVDPVALEPFAEAIQRAQDLSRTILALTEIEPTPQLLGLIVMAKVARPGATETVRALRKAGFEVELAERVTAPEDKDAFQSLGLAEPAQVTEPRPAIKIVRPGAPTLDSLPLTVHFGGRAVIKGEEIGMLVARDDPRTLVDLIQFARAFRRRVPITLLLSSLPGAALIAVVLGLLPPAPLVITIVSVAGFLLSAATPQVLRLATAIANEVDEE